ncbi:hypothetical protein ABK040_007949 [Willaertia magna]
MSESTPFKAGPLRLKRATTAGKPVINIWNQNGHDSDASYRSNFNQTHNPWNVQLPIRLGFVDVPLYNNLLYIIMDDFKSNSALGFINVMNGQYMPSSLQIDGPQFSFSQVSPVFNANGDFFMVRNVNNQLSLMKVDKFRNNVQQITDLSALQIINCLAVDDINNIVFVASGLGIYAVNGKDGSIVWKSSTDLTSTSNGLTIVNELYNNVPTQMLYSISPTACLLKVKALSGELLFQNCYSQYKLTRPVLGSENIYMLSSQQRGKVTSWFVLVLNKENGGYVSSVKLVTQDNSGLVFCSDITKVNNNLVLYCLGSEQNVSYLFSLNTKGLVSIKYSVKHDGELSEKIVALQNNDFVIKSGNSYVQFNGDNGTKKNVVAPSVPSPCTASAAVAANNNMLYYCCDGSCGAVTTLP